MFLLLLCLVAGADAQSFILTCEPGDDWVRENVHFKCLENPQTGDHGFTPYECISPEEVVVQPGTIHSEGNFKYECRQDDDLTIVWEVLSCYTPSGVELGVGSEIVEGDGTYGCTRIEETGDVKRSFIRRTTCEYGGKFLEVDERHVDGEGIYSCTFYNQELQIVPIGCRTADNKDLGPFQTLNGQVCEVRRPPDGPLAFLKPLKAQCTDQTGVRRDIGESWRFENVEYKCDVIRGVNIPKLTDEFLEIKPKACYMELPNQTLKIWINQAAKGKDKKFYSCQPEGNGPEDTVYVPREVPADKAKCGKRKLLKFWVKNNQFCRCAWGGDRAKQICFKCVSNNRKQIAKNRIYEEKKGEAYLCEPAGVNKLNYRRLTPEEYDLYKKGYRVIGDVGNPGSGLSWRDDKGNVICVEGYMETEKTCVDANECEELTHTCGEFERCQNTEGSFLCYCKYGFARNSIDQTCEDVSCGC